MSLIKFINQDTESLLILWCISCNDTIGIIHDIGTCKLRCIPVDDEVLSNDTTCNLIAVTVCNECNQRANNNGNSMYVELSEHIVRDSNVYDILQDELQNSMHIAMLNGKSAFVHLNKLITYFTSSFRMITIKIDESKHKCIVLPSVSSNFI